MGRDRRRVRGLSVVLGGSRPAGRQRLEERDEDVGLPPTSRRPPISSFRRGPKGDLDFIPVFQPPPEPAKPALSDKELKAMKGELDSVQKRDDAVRQAFPPAVKAAAEEAAAKKAKMKPATAGQ